MGPYRTPTFEIGSAGRRIWKEMVQEVGRKPGGNGAVPVGEARIPKRRMLSASSVATEAKKVKN